MRKSFALLAAGATVIALVGTASAFASANSRHADALSPYGFAGYSWGRNDFHTFRLSAAVRVPHLICSGKANQSALAGIQVYDGSTSYFPAAELFMGCVDGDAAVYPAVSTGQPYPTGYPQDPAQPGDIVELSISVTRTIYTVSVVDETHHFKVGGSPTHLNSRLYQWTGGLGDYPWQVRGSNPPPVPDFGKLHYSHVLFQGSPIGSAKGAARNQWKGKIATSAIGKDHESFTTIFEHS